MFYKWYKDTRNKIVEVKVDDRSSLIQEEREKVHQPEEIVSTSMRSSSVCIFMELYMINGLHISQKNLSYQELKQL
ncbi:hypothetical protein HMPREF1068_01426 [Bacteroides nordii CL02T12C05]|mgnify:CR=1 FL=1|jgi:hypothetical protein|uniref:Uncharacterized protein n=1 Tax=Bacteroides nordii CL02T12C05 TaxID=997884 RepID=I9GXN3_9BACE|nr:hypothetical protein HMPREF1068_01426 [Bacteroides nordii CL02T12C05]